MRFLSVLLILGGLALAFVLPIYQTDHAGDEVASLVVFDRTEGGWANGWRDGEVELDTDGNPYRLRLEGEFAGEVFNLPPQLPVFVELAGPQGVVFSGEFAFGVREETGRSGATDPGLFLSLPEFAVLDAGVHKLAVRLLTPRDVSLGRVDAHIVANAQAADWSFTPIGLALFAIGAVLYLVAGRRRKKERQGQQRKWGR